MTTDRKAPCPCGSGRRYKSCCYATDRAAEDAARRAAVDAERRRDVWRRETPPAGALVAPNDSAVLRTYRAPDAAPGVLIVDSDEQRGRRVWRLDVARSVAMLAMLGLTPGSRK